jgi:hypothetical protein
VATPCNGRSKAVSRVKLQCARGKLKGLGRPAPGP